MHRLVARTQFGRSFDAPSWMARTSGLSGRGLGTNFFGFLISVVRLSFDPMIKLLSVAGRCAGRTLSLIG
jgi:hypothetical protein